jgi:hypothetical protein
VTFENSWATNDPIEPENEQTRKAQAPAASAAYQSDKYVYRFIQASIPVMVDLLGGFAVAIPRCSQGMVKASPSGILGGLAGFSAFLAGVRKCRGVTPMWRLK